MRFKRFCSLGVAAVIGMTAGLPPFFPTTPTSRGWRNFMSFAPAMRRFPLQRPENPDFEPRIVPISDFESGAAEIIGVAVEFRRML